MSSLALRSEKEFIFLILSKSSPPERYLGIATLLLRDQIVIV